MKKFWASLLERLSSPIIQDQIIKFLNTDGIRYIVVSVLKLSGFKAWLITILIEEVIEEADEHLIEPLFREIGFQSDVLYGATIYKKVKDAQSVEDWVAELGDI